MLGLFTVIILIGLVLILFCINCPIAFAIGIPSLIYVMINHTLSLTIISQRMAGSLYSFILLALPAFLLAGQILNVAGVTEKIMDFSIALVGHLRGGLGYANAISSMMFASMSGTAIGDAGGLGAVEMRIMNEAGYSRDFSAGITAASSTVGPIIPPSVTLVLYGAIAQTSVSKLFAGGIVPGLLMTLSMCIYIYYRVNFTAEGKSRPIIKRKSLKEKFNSFIRAFPSLLTPVIIVVGIICGIVTPTEAAVLAIDYALILGLIYKKVNIKILWGALKETVLISGNIMFIFSVASFLGWVITLENIPVLILNLITAITNSPLIILLLTEVFILIIGCFLDTTAALLLIAPIFVPIVSGMGVDLVYFGVLMTMSLMIGIITPPFGICLFVVSDVAKISVARVTKATFPYLIPLILVLILVTIFPGLVMFLVNLL